MYRILTKQLSNSSTKYHSFAALHLPPDSPRRTPLAHEPHIIAYQSLWKDLREKNPFFNEMASNNHWQYDDYVSLSKELERLPPDSPLRLSPRTMNAPNKRVTEYVLNLIPDLLESRLWGDIGGTAHLLYGPREIQVSHILRNLTVALSLKDPNLVLIYVNCSIPLAPTPAHFLKAALQPRFGWSGSDEIEDILREYSVRGMKAIVIVDNLEQVYASNEYSYGREFLQDVLYLSSNSHGSNIVIACGRTELLPLLLSREGVHYESVIRDFPLVKQCPMLSTSKWEMLNLGKPQLGRSVSISPSKNGALHDKLHMSLFENTS